MKDKKNFAKETRAAFVVNTKIFPIEAVYAACNELLEDAHFIIDKISENELGIYIIPKNGKKKEDIENKLRNELVQCTHRILRENELKDLKSEIVNMLLKGKKYC